MAVGDKEFRERHSIGSESDKAEKHSEEDREEAVKMVGRELARYAQNTSEKHFMQDIIFGRHSVNENESFLLSIEPQSIWDRIVGRFKEEPERWKTVE